MLDSTLIYSLVHSYHICLQGDNDIVVLLKPYTFLWNPHIMNTMHVDMT